MKFCCGFLAALLLVLPSGRAATNAPPVVAGITTIYHHNSHADVILSRLFQTYTLDGHGEMPAVKLASLYVDQVLANDLSKKFSAQYGVPIYDTIATALTRGTGQLAVDGVLLVAEHGNYPVSDTGQTVYPKRRMFEEIVNVFETSGRVVPVFVDKHLADNWTDAKWIYDTAQRMKIPLMAGSSLPLLWRRPAIDLKQDAPVKEVVAISYHTLDHYGFHALEMLQCLVEHRAGGETGVKAVQCWSGPAVWGAEAARCYDPRLLKTALARCERQLPADKTLAELVAEPSLFVIEYVDGLRASILTLNYAMIEWAIAWRYADETVEATNFWTQEARPFGHFTFLLQGIEKMILTGKPTWPVERTLLTSGTLDALLISKKQGGQRIETPHLRFGYRTDWEWQRPPDPPGGSNQ